MIKLFEYKIYIDKNEPVPLCWKVFSLLCMTFMMLVMMALCVSCQPDDIRNEETVGSPAVIRLKVAGQEQVDAATRAVNEDAINNLHILIYNSKGELIGQQYSTSNTISVNTYSATSCTIYAIANTGKSDLFKGYHSENTLKAMLYTINTWSEAATPLIMVGVKGGVTISAGTQTLSGGITVTRMVAKVTLDIGVKLGSGITITGYKICKLPSKSSYIPNTTDATNSSWLESGIQDAGNVTTTKIVFYMFENRRGTISSITQQKDKNANNAPANATHVIISGNLQGIAANWTVYLGENNTTDFNIKRNCSYTYKIVLEAGKADSRVSLESTGVSDLSSSGNANCYLASKDNQWYSITGTIRGNGNTQDYANEQYPGVSMMPSIISGATRAVDIPISAVKDAIVVWETSIGLIGWVIWDCNTGTVKFKTGTNKGNAVIAVRDSSGKILWSWHIWRTDEVDLATLNSNHTMSIITNTARTWYTNLPSIGVSAGRQRSIVMTRCSLGSQLNSGKSYLTPDGNIGIYNMQFQYGRKDPFPGSNSYTAASESTIYGYGSSAAYQTSGFTIGKEKVEGSSSLGATTQELLNYTINHPERFIYFDGVSTNWIYNATVGSNPWKISNCLWGDNNKTSGGNNSGFLDPLPWGVTGETGKKTIYDPCPAGWRISPTDSWTGLADNGSDRWLAVDANMSITRMLNGVIFDFKTCPEKTFCPLPGYRASSSGVLTSVGEQYSMWWSSPSSQDLDNASYFYHHTPSSCTHLASDYCRAHGFTVRCVKE